MTAEANKGRPDWSIHPPDIRRALKTAVSRCYALIREARRAGNQPVVDAFGAVLTKIKDADQAVREARALYGWEAPPDNEGADVGTSRPNACCGNSGSHREGGREHCSTCGADLRERTSP